VSRLPKLHPGELDEAQRTLYEAIAGGPRAQGPQAFALTDEAGGLEGPFDAMLRSPGVGAALQDLGAAVRYRSALSDRAREIAILVVAHHWRSAFEIYAHEAVGAAVGLSAAELTLVREGRLAELGDETERTVGVTAAALAGRGDLDDTEYAAAADLGDAALFDLTTLVGYYATLALQLRVYRVSAPPRP
jgi:4-carboxymuconolactone decarboxylase